jgi:CPA1 family monovalent cation:H+ antiporter
MATVEIVLGLLLALAVVSALRHRVPVPLPLLLIFGGFLLGFVPAMQEARIDPHVFFLLFIPPLLFADGWLMPKRELLAVLRPVLLLAFGLVGLTVVAIGYLMHWLVPGLPLAAAFALGAIVSPTDAVATAAMVGGVGLPPRATHILNGESLINDASGLVAFKFAVAAVATGVFSPGDALIELTQLAAGGAFIGLAVAFATGRLRGGLRHRGRHDPRLQTILSLLTPFAAYLAAEAAATSGILAVVAAGLYAGWTDFRLLDAQTRQHAWEVWSMLLYAFNGLVFLMLGLTLAALGHDRLGIPHLQLAGYAFALWAALTLLRLAWVYPAAYLPRWLSTRVRAREGPRDPRQVFLVGWAGLRGSVTMAAALSVPLTIGAGAPFPGRNLLVALASTTILLTLLINGLTLPVLVRALGIRTEDATAQEHRAAEIAISHAATHALEVQLARPGTQDEAAAARRLLADYHTRLELHTANAERRREGLVRLEANRRIALVALEAEREELYRLRDTGVINDETVRAIESRIDHTELLLTGAVRQIE